MTMKEFISDFKEMVKTKNVATFNLKYVQPALEKSKEAAIATKDTIVKYTPVVVDAAKAGWDKASVVFQKNVEKANGTTQTKDQTGQTHQTKDSSQTQTPKSTPGGSNNIHSVNSNINRPQDTNPKDKGPQI